MDAASISALVTAVKTATDIAKFFKDSDLSLEKAEHKLKLAELIGALADVKMEVTQVQVELTDREAKIRDLNSRLEIRESMIWTDPVYWRQNGNTKEGPYCQPCFDKEQRLVRLQSIGTGHWGCRVCNQGFTELGTPHTTQSRISSEYDPFNE